MLGCVYKVISVAAVNELIKISDVCNSTLRSSILLRLITELSHVPDSETEQLM